jgi:uncharacterized C2H2 Zn-finger protein
MADASIEGQYFEHLAEYQLSICKECRHAVWPNQIEGHLQRVHRISRKHTEAVGEGVRRWPSLIQYPIELEVPSQKIAPIRQLPVYPNGLLCQLDATRCRQVLRSEKAMKEHWRLAHGYSVGKTRGRLSRVKEQVVQAQVEEGCKRIWCQRFFV